jgi:transposase
VLAPGQVKLDHHLYTNARDGSFARPLPDWAEIHTELGMKGVTLQLLHIEYLERHHDGYAYTQFCDYYRRWRKKQKRSMRQIHRAGEKLFIDYSGKKPVVVDPGTGQVREVELLDRQRWKTRVELANAIFEYLEIFHNRQRRHSSLGMVSPIEYEMRNAS